MFGRKKMYKKGLADAMQAYEAFGKKQEEAIAHMREEVRSGNKKLEDALAGLGDDLNGIYDYLNSQEKAALYHLGSTPIDIKDLEKEEKQLLLAILYQLATDEGAAITDAQRAYIRSIQKYLEITNPQTVADLSVVETIDSLDVQKVFLQVALEFFYLQDSEELSAAQEIFLDYFSVNKKQALLVENGVSRMFNAVGAQGLAEKYGYMPEVELEEPGEKTSDSISNSSEIHSGLTQKQIPCLLDKVSPIFRTMFPTSNTMTKVWLYRCSANDTLTDERIPDPVTPLERYLAEKMYFLKDNDRCTESEVASLRIGTDGVPNVPDMSREDILVCKKVCHGYMNRDETTQYEALIKSTNDAVCLYCDLSFLIRTGKIYDQNNYNSYIQAKNLGWFDELKPIDQDTMKEIADPSSKIHSKMVKGQTLCITDKIHPVFRTLFPGSNMATKVWLYRSIGTTIEGHIPDPATPLERYMLECMKLLGDNDSCTKDEIASLGLSNNGIPKGCHMTREDILVCKKVCHCYMTTEEVNQYEFARNSLIEALSLYDNINSFIYRKTIKNPENIEVYHQALSLGWFDELIDDKGDDVLEKLNEKRKGEIRKISFGRYGEIIRPNEKS